MRDRPAADKFAANLSEMMFRCVEPIVERTLQAQREADREELVRRIEDLKWAITMDDLHGQVKDGHHYVRVKHVNAKLLALKSQVAALIKDTKPL